jgi:hypothetical protein
MTYPWRERNRAIIAYTSCLVASSDNQLIENKFVLLTEYVVNMRILNTVDLELNVIKYAKEHANGAAERHFGPSATDKMIHEWRKQGEELQELEKNKHSFHTHSVKWPDLEEEVRNWITGHRNKRISMSTKIIIFEVRSWGLLHSITDFAGTASWCYRFMKRHGLRMCSQTRIAQKVPAEYKTILRFQKFIIAAKKKSCFELGQIVNMDEFLLTFSVPSNKTVDIKVSVSVMMKISGHEKTHYNVVLACFADGTKLPPLLILKNNAW